MIDILKQLIVAGESLEASDIHLLSGHPPRFRVRGELAEHGPFEAFDANTVDAIVMDLGLSTIPPGSPDGTERIRMTLLSEGAIDGAFSSPSGSRYRFNIYRESGRHAAAIRRLDSRFRSFEELGLPSRLRAFCDEREGLVVVTGPTGSGKTTTLATMIDTINRRRKGHVVTIEDPVEYIHDSLACIVHQRQVGRDTKSFNDALVEALRQDPDVILVGEMRDLATVRTALRAAETGHLVFTTLHAGDTPGAVERIISNFPPEEQSSARHQLALSLRGIFAQRLLPSRTGDRRHPAFELLVNTPACANLIATARSAQIYSLLETGGNYGMCSMDQSLADLYTSGKIAENTALANSRNLSMFRGKTGLAAERMRQ